MFKEFAKKYPWLNLTITASLFLAACRPPSTPTATLESTPPPTPTLAPPPDLLAINSLRPTETPIPTPHFSTHSYSELQKHLKGLVSPITITRSAGFRLSDEEISFTVVATGNGEYATTLYSIIKNIQPKPDEVVIIDFNGQVWLLTKMKLPDGTWSNIYVDGSNTASDWFGENVHRLK